MGIARRRHRRLSPWSTTIIKVMSMMWMGGGGTLDSVVQAFGYSRLPYRLFPSPERRRRQRDDATKRHRRFQLANIYTTKESDDPPTTNPKNNDDNHSLSSSSSILPLLQLASAHCTSQALHTFVQLGIPTLLMEDGRSLEDIANEIGPTTNIHALGRCLRLLTTVDILEEELRHPNHKIFFSLTRTGRLLVPCHSSENSSTNDHPPSSSSGMAACIQHWMEQPLWDAWLELPAYIRGDDKNDNDTNNRISTPPFDRANGGISSDYYYNAQDHPQSLAHANDFVKFIHGQEIQAIVELDHWKTLPNHSKVVDIGGHHGQVLSAVGQRYRHLDLYSLDLPAVVDSCLNQPLGVTLI